MNTTSKEYALLSQDAYKDRTALVKSPNGISIGNIQYEVLDTKINSITGYQGTVYRRIDTGEVIIAHRGSEFDREPLKDGAFTDGGMVFTGLNAQARDAEVFTKHAIELAKQASERDGKPLHITVTGHSLGGALAELTAYKFHLHGVTFNGYGAADLGYHLPEGGDLVTNYVRATDVVSAVSHHFGKLVVVATADDIRQLEHNGYHDHATTRNPLGAISAEAHSITNFVDQPDRPSDLSAENKARARAHHSAIARYREDVHDLHANVLSLAWRLEQKKETAMALGGAATNALLHGDRDTAEKLASLAVHRTADNLAHATHVATSVATLGIAAIDQTGAYIADGIKREARAVNRHVDQAADYLGRSADNLAHHTQRVAQNLEQAMQPFVHGIAHHANLARGVSATPPHNELERDTAASPRVDVSAITPHSSIDNMFEALYQATVADDRAGFGTVSQAYRDSAHGHAFLQQGREYNRQLEMQQATQKQVARQGPAMSR